MPRNNITVYFNIVTSYEIISCNRIWIEVIFEICNLKKSINLDKSWFFTKNTKNKVMKFKRKDIYAYIRFGNVVNIAIPVISCFAKNKEKNSPNVRDIRIHNMSITHLIFINVSKRSNSKYPKNRIYLWQGIRRLEIRVEWMNSGVRRNESFNKRVWIRKIPFHRVFLLYARVQIYFHHHLPSSTQVISNITLSRARMSGLSDFPHAVVPTVDTLENVVDK